MYYQKFGLLISVIGIIFSLGGFAIDNFYVICAGIITILIYAGVYIKERFFDSIQKNKNLIKNLSKEINTLKEFNLLKERISYLEGIVDMIKNKKGFLDPISLVIVIILLVMVIFFLKENGFI